jgi:hypothetical protein
MVSSQPSGPRRPGGMVSVNGPAVVRPRARDAGTTSLCRERTRRTADKFLMKASLIDPGRRGNDPACTLSVSTRRELGFALFCMRVHGL